MLEEVVETHVDTRSLVVVSTFVILTILSTFVF